MSIEQTDADAALVAVAPRVSLSDIEDKIVKRYDLVGADAIAATHNVHTAPASLETLSLCILVMANGFMVVGKSAPASPENFDADLGTKLAYEDCIRQLWPLEGYLLRSQLCGE